MQTGTKKILLSTGVIDDAAMSKEKGQWGPEETLKFAQTRIGVHYGLVMNKVVTAEKAVHLVVLAKKMKVLLSTGVSIDVGIAKD